MEEYAQYLPRIVDFLLQAGIITAIIGFVVREYPLAAKIFLRLDKITDKFEDEVRKELKKKEVEREAEKKRLKKEQEKQTATSAAE